MKQITDVITSSTTTPKPSGIIKPPNGLTKPDPGLTGVCEICGGLGCFKNDLPPGHPCFGKFIPCPCQKPARQERLADLSGLKEHERQFRLDDLVAFNASSKALVQCITTFIENPRGWLFIWGPPGNGKTLALQVVVNEMVDRGFAAVYNTFADLADLMRYTFDPRESGGESFMYRFQRVLKIKVLAIDEFDKVNQTPFIHEFRSKLIDHRDRDAIAARRATLFAGNEDPALLPHWIADRIHDGRYQVFHNPGRSVRAAQTW